MPSRTFAGYAHTQVVCRAGVFIPSLADCFFAAVLVSLFIAGPNGWKALLADGDTGWHIRTGQYIWANHAVPTHDLFSFSRPGAPWYAWEWLSDLMFAGLFALGGMKALLCLSAALIGIFSVVLLRFAIWRGADPLVAGFVTLLSLGASTIHFLTRPHLFTLVLLPLCIWIVEVDRRHASRNVWLLLPITALWTNLHGGWVIWIACLAILVVAVVIEVQLGRTERAALLRYSALLAGCSAMTLVNPYGTALHRHILQYLRSDWIRNTVQEFQAPSFRGEGQLQFEILLVVGLCLVGQHWRQRRVPQLLWTLFLAHSALTSLRHAPLYVAVTGPLIAEQLTRTWRSWAASRPQKSVFRILYDVGIVSTPAFERTTFWPAMVLIGIALLPGMAWPTDFPRELFPTRLVDRHATLLSNCKILTSDQWGDYLIFRFYPRSKVFIDGRSDFYGEELGRDYLRLMQASSESGQLLEQYRFDAALLPVDWPLCSLLKMDTRWTMVESDGRGVLFVRSKHGSDHWAAHGATY